MRLCECGTSAKTHSVVLIPTCMYVCKHLGRHRIYIHRISVFLIHLYINRAALTSAVWGRRTPAAIGQAGDLLVSIQQEVLFTEVEDVKADLVFSQLDGDRVAVVHVWRRLAVHT